MGGGDVKSSSQLLDQHFTIVHHHTITVEFFFFLNFTFTSFRVIHQFVAWLTRAIKPTICFITQLTAVSIVIKTFLNSCKETT